MRSKLQQPLEETVAAVDSKLKFCIHCGIPDLVPINVFQIAHSLEMYLCKALPGMHAVPGCDTVSFFKLKGKSTPWKFFKENQARFTNVLITLRKTLEEILSEDSLSDLEAYICQFYPHKGRVLERANDARERQLKPESKLVSDESFPPQRVCLHQRFLRAQYQAFQWCHASQGHLNLPSPTEFGFEEVDSKLKVNWFDGDMLPPSLHTRVSCGCQTGSLQVAKMWLSKSGTTLQCNENCKCQGCSNCGDHATEDGEDDDEEDAGKSGSDSSAD